MIVGADGLASIVNGSLLRLNLDGRVEVLDEPQRIEKAVSKQQADVVVSRTADTYRIAIPNSEEV